MKKPIVITPVKDSIETTLKTARSIADSDTKVDHIIFNDFSSPETRYALEKFKDELGYHLVNLEEIIDSPSPNYNYVLNEGRRLALERDVPLIIVESDVFLKQDTLGELLHFGETHDNAGLVGAITVNQFGEINFPYKKFRGIKRDIHRTERSLSFCCTLISQKFLRAMDISTLNKKNHWYDTILSRKALALGFENYILKSISVIHEPHSSRPWKQEKYKNLLKYYYEKFITGRDKI